MSSKQNLVPAFPIPFMTLRDYFAAKAMQGMCANPDDGHQAVQDYSAYVAEIAEDCYQIADAMMEARK